jgi:hypothetical protein
MEKMHFYFVFVEINSGLIKLMYVFFFAMYIYGCFGITFRDKQEDFLNRK